MAARPRPGGLPGLSPAAWDRAAVRPAPHTFDSTTSAEHWLTLTEAEIIQGGWIHPDGGRVLFGNYAADWIKKRPGLRPKTTELYRYLLHRHLSPTFDSGHWPRSASLTCGGGGRISSTPR